MSDETEPTTSQGTKDQTYRRGYVACMGCRARKVRCILSNKPPCAKCAREHRECIFQNTRKPGKHREAPRWTQGRPQPFQKSDVHDLPDLTSQPTAHNSADTHVPSVTSNGFPVETHQHTFDTTTDNDKFLSHRVMSTILARPGDALDVLFDAARPEHSLQGDPPSLRPGAGIQSLAFHQSHCAESGQVSVSGLSRPSEEVLDLWDRCRFVRQGWFTAQEAVTYLDLFCLCLAPLSPVLPRDSLNHENHERLVTEEPMLCCTLLAISSRFFVLPGAGGVSRSHFIHSRLWEHCEVLIRRVMFGQEKHSTAKTRVVGTIESLMLISDWHPRAVHFPPETNGWDGELISPGYDRRNRLHTDNDAPLIRWREDVFEPAKRSERMSWMLLGAAVNLAYELGIFADGLNGLGSSLDSRQYARMNRAKRLLYIYVTQMACRMGCSSLLPETISFSVPDSSAQTIDSIDQSWESYMSLWVDLTRHIKTASAMFFHSGLYIKHQLMSGNYSILLQQFAPSLASWLENFTSQSLKIPEALRSLLLIEYHYLKAYTSALSIQAVVERALSRGIARFGDVDCEGIEPCMFPQDRNFIKDVVSASRQVLELATMMHHEGRLRYAPLQTLICVTSSSIFLLKAISLGGHNDDLQTSLGTLDRCIAALKLSGTDDMDFSFRYATLIEKHVARFRTQFAPPSHSAPVQETNNGHRGTPIIPLSHVPQLDGSHVLNGTQHQSFSDSRMGSREDWWARPFDPNIAPFPLYDDGISLGLGLDSLDFLFNLPNMNDSGS